MMMTFLFPSCKTRQGGEKDGTLFRYEVVAHDPIHVSW